MLRNFYKSLPRLSYTSFRFSNPSYHFSSEGDDKISWAKKIKEEGESAETPNPFFNPQAALLKSQMNQMQQQIKEWQEVFKKKHGRKPTLDEMKSDHVLGPIFSSLEKQRHALKATIQRFHIN
jgi:hypothetical protein